MDYVRGWLWPQPPPIPAVVPPPIPAAAPPPIPAAAPPPIHDARYDAAANLGVKTLVHPDPGSPINQEHAQAAQRFARQQTSWTPAQTNISAIGNFNFGAVDVPAANQILGRLKRAGPSINGQRRELKFLDKNAIDRSAGSKLRIPTRIHNSREDRANRPYQVGHWVLIWQYDVATHTYVHDTTLGAAKSLLRKRVNLSFRPMLPETELVLQAYIDGNDVLFATQFLQTGVALPGHTTLEIMNDLKGCLTEGPLFSMETTKRIMDEIYVRLDRGVHTDTNLFKVGVEVLTNNILTNMFKSHGWRDKYTVKPIKRREINQNVPLQTQQILHTFAAPASGTTIDVDVYRQALQVSLVTEACLAAADRVDEANQNHTKHVAIGVGFAFAAVKAILDIAPPPVNMVAAVGEFFDPIKDSILKKTEDKYTKQTIRAVVKDEFDKIMSDAESGYIVPGLNNELGIRNQYRNSVGEDNVIRLVHEERKTWGVEFAKHVKQIRPYAR